MPGEMLLPWTLSNQIQHKPLNGQQLNSQCPATYNPILMPLKHENI